MDVKIHTDSKYAYKCMAVWKRKWIRNDFTTSDGRLLANRDLLREAYDLQDDLEQEGRVRFVWVKREQNHVADAEVKELLDEMEQDC